MGADAPQRTSSGLNVAHHLLSKGIVGVYLLEVEEQERLECRREKLQNALALLRLQIDKHDLGDNQCRNIGAQLSASEDGVVEFCNVPQVCAREHVRPRLEADCTRRRGSISVQA